ncbi:class I SAM-dependent methyltransferase [Nocardioides alcanivorans]|uniref:class I SAM-dependent methyltransferase n=1 Tax=Nocardioides alcanivorans TaxID=2897352 RepID=UPI0024B1BE2F|nr:class I SAM-dependent methyltransferase [Nocardioides alcanivorans]
MSQNVSNSGHRRRYTHGHEPATLASHGTRSAANSAAYLLPVLNAGMRVLDVGCGPGTITLDLAEVIAPGQVVGVENVEAPLEAARKAAESRGDTRTVFQQGDVMALPFDDHSFDVVHAHQVLQHLTDPVAALKEMARVCKPGGWVAARDADYAGMAWHPELPGLETWRGLYRAVARANGAEPDAGRRIRAWANAAGLGDAQFTSSTWTYADPEICRWWGESQATRYSSSVFTTQAGEQGASTHQLTQIAADWRAWSTSPDAWFTIWHGELLAQIA